MLGELVDRDWTLVNYRDSSSAELSIMASAKRTMTHSEIIVALVDEKVVCLLEQIAQRADAALRTWMDSVRT